MHVIWGKLTGQFYSIINYSIFIPLLIPNGNRDSGHKTKVNLFSVVHERLRIYLKKKEFK